MRASYDCQRKHALAKALVRNGVVQARSLLRNKNLRREAFELKITQSLGSEDRIENTSCSLSSPGAEIAQVLISENHNVLLVNNPRFFTPGTLLLEYINMLGYVLRCR